MTWSGVLGWEPPHPLQATWVWMFDSEPLSQAASSPPLLLQDMQVTGVEDDSRALSIIIHKPASSPHSKPFPILQATFIFSDHIRCIIAKQRLAKGRIQARRMKMQRIAGNPSSQRWDVSPPVFCTLAVKTASVRSWRVHEC